MHSWCWPQNHGGAFDCRPAILSTSDPFRCGASKKGGRLLRTRSFPSVRLWLARLEDSGVEGGRRDILLGIRAIGLAVRFLGLMKVWIEPQDLTCAFWVKVQKEVDSERLLAPGNHMAALVLLASNSASLPRKPRRRAK